MPLYLEYTQPLKAYVPLLFGLVTLVCAVTDMFRDKIYNWVTVPTLVLGIGVSLYAGDGFVMRALSGVGIAAAVFIPLFFFGVMGGGDVKLVMALSSVLGVPSTLDLISGCFIAGGIGALVVLVLKKRVRIFMQEVFKFLKTVMVKHLEVEFPKLDKSIKAPFGFAILAGYLYAVGGALW